MLIKVVLDKQIRVFDCKEIPTIQLIQSFIGKTFHHVKKYSIYYLDEDNDQIILESNIDLNVLLSNKNIKIKIYVKPMIEEFFDSTVKTQVDLKSQKIQLQIREKQQLCKIQQNQPQRLKEQIKNQEEMKQVNQFKEIHQGIRCDKCGVSPITGIRYKCSVCSNYDLCSECQVEGHLHPLIKLRTSNISPINCKLEFCEQKAKEIAQKMSRIDVNQKQSIVFQTKVERQQMIISYLGNILGEDDFSGHKNFSKIAKSQYYQDLLQEYLTWIEGGGNQSKYSKFTNWIMSYFTAIKQNFQ